MEQKMTHKEVLHGYVMFVDEEAYLFANNEDVIKILPEDGIAIEQYFHKWSKINDRMFPISLENLIRKKDELAGQRCKLYPSQHHTIVEFMNNISWAFPYKEGDPITVFYDFSFEADSYKQGYLKGIDDDLKGFTFKDKQSEEEDGIKFTDIQAVTKGNNEITVDPQII